jgi:carbon monoxide dehydrogenase subunit G
MNMTGECRIAAPRQAVWDALNDADILMRCIPGCEELVKTSDTTFEAKVTAAVGPVKAKFTGAVTLTDIDPPNSYRLNGEGKGGPAGFAKGGANVTLTEDGEGTLLSYEVEAKVGGKLAQLGGRIIDPAAKKLANDFFGKFTEILGGVEAPVPAAEAAAEKRVLGLPPLVWAAGTAVILALLAFFYFD